MTLSLVDGQRSSHCVVEWGLMERNIQLVFLNGYKLPDRTKDITLVLWVSDPYPEGDRLQRNVGLDVAGRTSYWHGHDGSLRITRRPWDSRVEYRPDLDHSPCSIQ